MASLLLAQTALGAHPFVGVWLATAEAPSGNVSERIVVTELDDGYTVTAKLVDGQAAPGSPEAGPGTDIVLEGDTFSYKRAVGDFVISYSGSISGNAFTGTVDMGFAQVPYKGVRMDAGSQGQ